MNSSVSSSNGSNSNSSNSSSHGGSSRISIYNQYPVLASNPVVTNSDLSNSAVPTSLIGDRRIGAGGRRPHKRTIVALQKRSPEEVIKSAKGRRMGKHNYDDKDWEVTECSSDRTSVKVTYRLDSGITDVVIQKRRVSSFKQKCDMSIIRQQLAKPSSCQPVCKRKCTHHTTLNSILEVRKDIYGRLSPTAQLEDLTCRLRNINPNIAEKVKGRVQTVNLVYFFGGRSVCGRFWAMAHGVSEDRMKKVRRMVKGGCIIWIHGNRGRYQEQPQYITAYTFWFNFFEMNCQQPNNDLRLFPVNESFRFIYNNYFIPWISKRLYQLQLTKGIATDDLPWAPSETTFVRARWDEAFKDVSQRARHYHAQCRKCNGLKVRRLKGFLNDDHKASWQIENDLHEMVKLGWRKLEASREAEVLNPNSNTVLLSYDDTNALGLPRLSNRDIKNGPKSKFKVIPFNICNYASGENAYVYTVSGRYLKGGNRLCTVLYHIIRKLKWGSHKSRAARILVLHADNASENKNNTVFCFFSELILRGWFDRIIMEFGPPGHTHNGRDAVHHIHNRIAGNFYSFTLGEFQRHWKNSWYKKGTMPEAVIMDAQYDWDDRYKNLKRMAGCWNTVKDPQQALAFLFKRNTDGLVEVKFKHNHSSKWLGREQLSTNEGFVVLPQIPVGPPIEIIPNDNVMSPEYITNMTGPAMEVIMRPYMKNEDEVYQTLEWLFDAAVTGSMPYTVVHNRESNEESDAENESELRPDQWGVPVTVGVPGKEGEFFLVEPVALTSKYGFWELPPDLEEVSQADQKEMQDLIDQHNKPPLVRLVPPKKPTKKGNKKTTNKTVKKPKSRKKRKKKLAPEEPVEFVPTHGPPKEDCNIGEYAIVHVKYKEGEGSGVEVMRVTSYVEDIKDQTLYHVTGEMFGPASGKSNGVKCLTGIWNTRQKEETHKSWSVITFFAQLTQGRKLPGSVKRHVIERQATELLIVDEFNSGSECEEESDQDAD
jgi:hypothetical protein